VAHVLSKLANLYLLQGKYELAEAFSQRAWHIQEQHLGQDHPEMAQTLHNLAVFQQKQGNLSKALSLAERALKIRSQALGDTHPKTVATQALYAQLIQEQRNAKKGASSQQRGEETSDPLVQGCISKSEACSSQEASHVPSSENDPVQEFFTACCELHPLAWCCSADLWQAYRCWVEEQHDRYPLSRGTFITQLKAHGCRADRTMTARIWRGIAVSKKNYDGP
jgi:tetratricopeptide (TPR) repeat protein